MKSCKHLFMAMICATYDSSLKIIKQFHYWKIHLIPVHLLNTISVWIYLIYLLLLAFAARKMAKACSTAFAGQLHFCSIEELTKF